MKTRTAILLAAAGALLPITSCTTTYDAYGRPVQTVDPGTAAAAAAAAGVAGYAIGRHNDHGRRNYYYYYGSRHGHGYHPRGRW